MHDLPMRPQRWAAPIKATHNNFIADRVEKTLPHNFPPCFSLPFEIVQHVAPINVLKRTELKKIKAGARSIWEPYVFSKLEAHLSALLKMIPAERK